MCRGIGIYVFFKTKANSKFCFQWLQYNYLILTKNKKDREKKIFKKERKIGGNKNVIKNYKQWDSPRLS